MLGLVLQQMLCSPHIYLLHVNLIILEECKSVRTDLGRREGIFPSDSTIALDSSLLFSLLSFFLIPLLPILPPTLPLIFGYFFYCLWCGS